MNSTITTTGPVCPRCGAVMEEIESAFDDLALDQVHLCPSCYLVMWRDSEGLQFGQGTPVQNTHRIVES